MADWIHVLDWEKGKAELFAGTFAVNMHKLQCHAMLELTQERFQGNTLRYVSTLHIEIFGSADSVLWIERPDGYQKGRPER